MGVVVESQADAHSTSRLARWRACWRGPPRGSSGRKTNLPKMAAPARRALQGAGYTRLEDLTKVTESDVMRLHGMGPNAM